jgi:hypothetical protein
MGECRRRPSAAYDGGQLGVVLDRDKTASDVWADTASVPSTWYQQIDA